MEKQQQQGLRRHAHKVAFETKRPRLPSIKRLCYSVGVLRIAKQTVVPVLRDTMARLASRVMYHALVAQEATGVRTLQPEHLKFACKRLGINVNGLNRKQRRIKKTKKPAGTPDKEDTGSP